MAFRRREILLLADICTDLCVETCYGIDEVGREVSESF